MASRRRKGHSPELPKRLIEIGQEQTVAMLRPIRLMVRALAQTLSPADDSVRGDVAIVSGAAYSALAQVLVEWVRGVITPEMAREQATRNVGRVRRHAGLTIASWAEVMGIDPKVAAGRTEAMVAAQIERAIEEQARLIASITDELADQVAAQINDAIRRGERAPDIAGILEDRLGVASSRAELIARDQATKAQGVINKTRQQAMGVRRYEWRTAQDERVRPSHAALNGEVFSWDAPPSVGHPGEPINCRCVALPILDDD